MFDKFIHSIGDRIYGHITSYLPWSYKDDERDTQIDVVKVGNDLQVTTYEESEDSTTVIVVVVPEEAIKEMLKK